MGKIFEIIFEICTTLGLRALVIQFALSIYQVNLSTSTLVWTITVIFGVVFAEKFTIRRKKTKKRPPVVEEEAEESAEN